MNIVLNTPPCRPIHKTTTIHSNSIQYIVWGKIDTQQSRAFTRTRITGFTKWGTRTQCERHRASLLHRNLVALPFHNSRTCSILTFLGMKNFFYPFIHNYFINKVNLSSVYITYFTTELFKSLIWLVRSCWLFF